MNTKKNIALRDYSTMRVGGPAQEFIVVSDKTELDEAVAYAKEQNQKFAVIGEGSNTLFTDHGYDGLIIKNEIKGIQFIEQDDGLVLVKAGAGETWDALVAMSVEKGLTGIEALSFIPGSVGAAPVQNIGAYGQELSETLVELEIYDTKDQKFSMLKNEDCNFAYRNSRFKRNRHEIVTTITLKLRTGKMDSELYESLAKYLEEKSIKQRDPQTIRDALEQIRWSKLPKPDELPNCGSYFHNVVVDADTHQELLRAFPDLKYYPTDDKFKIPTGWLLEQLGLKGYCDSNGVCHYDKQSLVITNPDGKANYQQLMQHEKMVRKMVRDRYGLELTREPNVID